MASSTIRRLALWIILGLSFVTITALTIFLIILSAGLASKSNPIQAASIAASGLEVLTLLFLALLAWRESNDIDHATASDWARTRNRRRLDMLLTSVSSSLGAAATIATGAWMGTNAADIETPLNLEPKLILIVVMILLFSSLLCQATVFALLFLMSKDFSSVIVLPSPTTFQATELWPKELAVRETKTSSSFHSKCSSAPPFTSDSRSMSLRSSITISTRPSTSRNPVSTSRPPSSSDSQFDTWDTSNVPLPLRDAIHSRNTTQPRSMAILPSIPDSRPVSPAKALDGPFLPPSPHPLQTSPTSPIREPTTPASPSATSAQPGQPPMKLSSSFESIPRPFAQGIGAGSSSTSLDKIGLPRTYSQTSLADSVSHLPARSAKQATSQENIHPLFRATSASPPPGASVGTNLTAASIEEAVQGLRRKSNSREGLRSRAASASSAYTPRQSPISARSPSDAALPRDPRLGSRSAARSVSNDKPAIGSSPLSRHSDWADQLAHHAPLLETSPPLTRSGSFIGTITSQHIAEEPNHESTPDRASDASSALPDYVVDAVLRASFDTFEQRQSACESTGSATTAQSSS